MTIKYEDIENVNKQINSLSLTQSKKDKSGKWVDETHEYAPVKERIIAFRKLFPMGVISTKVNFEDKFVTCVTEIYDGTGNMLANGHARESLEKRYALENCESSAIGRAIGMMGIGISTSLASAEDMDSYNKDQIFDEKPLNELKTELAFEFNQLFTNKEKADILNSFHVQYPEDLSAELLQKIIDQKKYGKKQNTQK